MEIFMTKCSPMFAGCNNEIFVLPKTSLLPAVLFSRLFLDQNLPSTRSSYFLFGLSIIRCFVKAIIERSILFLFLNSRSAPEIHNSIRDSWIKQNAFRWVGLWFYTQAKSINNWNCHKTFKNSHFSSRYCVWMQAEKISFAGTKRKSYENFTPLNGFLMDSEMANLNDFWNRFQFNVGTTSSWSTGCAFAYLGRFQLTNWLPVVLNWFVSGKSTPLYSLKTHCKIT